MSRKSYLDASVRNWGGGSSPAASDRCRVLARTHESPGQGGGQSPARAATRGREGELLATSATDTRPGGKPNAKSAVINGTFDLAIPEGGPSGWTIAPTIKIVRDGTNNVLREATEGIVYRGISQEIPAPPSAKSVTLSGRMRGIWVTRDTGDQLSAP